jgi:hypothetical protein
MRYNGNCHGVARGGGLKRVEIGGVLGYEARLAFVPFVWRPRTAPSHGANRGSSPLRDANFFKYFSGYPLRTDSHLEFIWNGRDGISGHLRERKAGRAETMPRPCPCCLSVWSDGLAKISGGQATDMCPQGRPIDQGRSPIVARLDASATRSKSRRTITFSRSFKPRRLPPPWSVDIEIRLRQDTLHFGDFVT